MVVVVTRVSGDGTTSGTGPSHHMCHGAAQHCSQHPHTHSPSPPHSHVPCVAPPSPPVPPVTCHCPLLPCVPTHLLLCHHHLLLVRVTTVCCPADAEQRTSPCPLYTGTVQPWDPAVQYSALYRAPGPRRQSALAVISSTTSMPRSLRSASLPSLW